MTLAFLVSLVRPYRAGLLVLMTILFMESAIALAIPWVGGRLGAAFLASGGEHEAVPLAVMILGLLFLIAVLRVVSSVLYARVTESILADLRVRLFNHLLVLPLPWHQARNRGDVLAIMTLEIERLGHFITGTIVALLPMAMTAIGATFLMLQIDPVLSFIVPILVPVFYITLRLFGRLLRGLAQQIQAEHATAVSMVEEMLDLLPSIKSFVVEPAERGRFAVQINKLRRLSLKEARIHAILDPAIQFAVAASVVVLLFTTGRSMQAGGLSPAETISFLLYVALLVRPVSSLASVYGEIQTAKGTLKRLQDVLSEKPEPMAEGEVRPRLEGDIRFERVTFSYPERGAAVRDLDLHIRAGEKVALTGPNGAGKSTCAGLLLGFFRPEAGRILLDGRDIAQLPLDHLRATIGYVPQGRHLRNASVAENIAFGVPCATQREIEAAARLAQAHEFVVGLPQAYETLIGDKGIRLSGGQQQRVALARALLKNPSVLILDEATSMYDLDGEAAFVADSKEALEGRTVILITHRPASLALADRVLQMDGGRIVGDVLAA